MIRLLHISIFIITILLSCSNNSNVAGTAESGNAKISGAISNESGDFLNNIIIHLIPSDYNPYLNPNFPDSLKDTTDVNGEYSIEINDSGNFNIYINNSTTNSGLIVRGIVMTLNDEINRTDTLKPLRTLTITTPGTKQNDSGVVLIQGTLDYQIVSETENFTEFKAIPTGILPSVVYIDAKLNSDEIIIAEDGEIEVTLDSNTSFGTFTEWKNKSTISINTSESGADILTDLLNFPILIRLDNNNFNFENTNSDGSDLRFTRSDTIILDYEIESWNQSSKTAIIWVKVDTIFANNNSQFIKMLWNNSNAVAVSSSEQVFDTTNGFAAVWHFPEIANTFNDATLNNNDGTNNGGIPQVSPIGSCIYFNGGIDDNYIDIAPSSSLRPENAITLQAWFNPDSVNVNQIESFFSYTNDDSSTESGFSFAYAFGNWKFLVVTEDMTADDINDNPGTEIPLDSWSLVTGTYDGNMIKVFLNGELISSEAKTGNIDWAPLPSICRIGMYKDANETYELNGAVDELRIMRQACSEDWIKMCYETQKEGSTVLSFK